jgi:hypothetical protein
LVGGFVVGGRDETAKAILKLQIKVDLRLRTKLAVATNDISLSAEIVGADGGWKAGETIVASDQIGIEFENVHRK